MHMTRRLLAPIALLVMGSILCAAPAFDERPVPERAPLPDYPHEMRKEKLEGTVVLGIAIDEKGAVTEAAVVKSTDARFEAAAVQIVRSKWRFKPAKKDGAPIACRVNVPIRFSLGD